MVASATTESFRRSVLDHSLLLLGVHAVGATAALMVQRMFAIEPAREPLQGRGWTRLQSGQDGLPHDKPVTAPMGTRRRLTQIRQDSFGATFRMP